MIATTTVRGQVKTAHAWWAITPPLRSGGRGFRTVVSDKTVVPGQVVTVTSVAHDAKGRPVPNLLVTWTWNYNGHRVHTHAVTDAHGRATSTQLITTATTMKTITVTAHTQSASLNRYAYHELQARSLRPSAGQGTLEDPERLLDLRHRDVQRRDPPDHLVLDAAREQDQPGLRGPRRHGLGGRPRPARRSRGP